MGDRDRFRIGYRLGDLRMLTGLRNLCLQGLSLLKERLLSFVSTVSPLIVTSQSVYSGFLPHVFLEPAYGNFCFGRTATTDHWRLASSLEDASVRSSINVSMQNPPSFGMERMIFCIASLCFAGERSAEANFSCSFISSSVLYSGSVPQNPSSSK